MTHPGRTIDFGRVAAAALSRGDDLVRRWAPDGRRIGDEWIARNPTRGDQRVGSFKVNLATGRWADFAVNAAGGDLVSLAAYLFGLSQIEAALKVATALGIDPYARDDRRGRR